jgi:hypothetical protein
VNDQVARVTQDVAKGQQKVGLPFWFGQPSICANGLVHSFTGALLQLATRLAEWVVLHDWRSVLRSAPAGGKAR